MKAAILTMGIRGDVEPYLALGLGLRHAGHDVLIATHLDFEQEVQEHALNFLPLPGSSNELKAIFSGAGIGGAAMLRSLPRLAGFATPLIEDLWSAARQSCDGADVVIHSMLTSYIAHHIARTNDQTSIGSLLYPIFTPTREQPIPLLGLADYGPQLNYFSHLTFNWMTNAFSRFAYLLVRRKNPGLPPTPKWPYQSGQDGPPLVLYAFSPTIIPAPSDWDETRVVTGYWQLERAQSWLPDPNLSEFLRDSPKPIFIGFGSMSRYEHRPLIMEAVTAVRRMGHRGVVQLPPDLPGRESLPHGFMAVDTVPHEWLFPQMAALIHHGGAGTTAAGLKAGIPTIVIPFFGDQPFWGRLVQERIGGPAPIPMRKLTADRLQKALQEALAEPVRENAAALGTTIRAENGVLQAVTWIERAAR